jgi:hypothetical protein
MKNLTTMLLSAMIRRMSANQHLGVRPKVIVVLAVAILLIGIGLFSIKTKNQLPASTKSRQFVTPPQQSFQTSPSSEPTVTWQVYTDATLGATFEYPISWKLMDTSSSLDVPGTDYTLTFGDMTVPNHEVSICISSISNPENLSLADFYRKYVSGGVERFKNIAFEEIVNPHGVRFERIVQPYTSPDNNDSLQTLHNSKIYEITKTFNIPLRVGRPADSNYDYHNDPIFQKMIVEYNHLIDSFTFIN